MKYNYPIKYAVMPIIEQVGWVHGLNELERNYDVVCYIVSKCYLLSDKTKYKENGKDEKEYEVVFPYQNQRRNYYYYERVTPSFNVFYHTCTNSNIVEKVFDCYEEALEFATYKNKELCKKNMIYFPCPKNLGDQILKKSKEFEAKLAKYKILEQQILVNTSDLEQSNVKKLNNLIINDKDKIKALSISLYEYLKSSYLKFIVYSISPEQYDRLITVINNRNTFDISNIMENANPILYYDYKSKGDIVMVINQNGNVLYYINEWESLIPNDSQKIPSVKLNAVDDETRRLFTTETLEDIELSFNEHEDIHLDEIQGSVLKKTLFDKNKHF